MRRISTLSLCLSLLASLLLLFASLLLPFASAWDYAVPDMVPAAASARSAPPVTAFAPLPDRFLCYPQGEEPAPEELPFPETLEAVRDGQWINLPVSWVCAGGGYGDLYYTQFCPVWDETAYPLGEGVDVPWIGVLLTDGGAVPSFWKSLADGGSCPLPAHPAGDAGEGGFLLSVTASPYEEEIYQWLREELGLNAAAACGVMVNLYAESSFRPNNLQNSYEKKLGFTDASYTEAVDSGAYDGFVHDKAGYGLCQWTYWSRKEGLLQWAREQGTSIGDLQMQLSYMRRELSAALLGLLRSVPDTADGAYEAASAFCLQFEKPANMEAAAVARGNLARETYFPAYGTEPEDSNPPNAIRDIQLSDAGVDAAYICSRHGIICAAAYGETTGQMTAFGSVDVPSGTGTALVSLLGEGASMPDNSVPEVPMSEGAVIRVFLLDAETFSPLCGICTYHTT